VADLRVKFMKVLKAEIEGVLEDVDVAERQYVERLARRDVTDYVFRQNDALFHAEADSLRRIVDSLDGLDSRRYPDLDALIKAVDALVREVVQDHEEPEVAYRCVSRKLEKVRRYVESP